MIPAYNGLATSHNYLGEPELALAAVEKAMRLSPHDSWAPNFYAGRGRRLRHLAGLKASARLDASQLCRCSWQSMERIFRGWLLCFGGPRR
jgi:hypothetical protein